MALEITGKVIQLLPEQTGTGKNGTWVRRDFVIETTDQYPKKVCFSGWGDKANIVNNLQTGQMVKVSFNPESREYNGKWYTDLRAWKIEANNADQQAFNDIPDIQNSNDTTFSDFNDNQKDDLPF
jgi:hypothetical protein